MSTYACSDLHGNLELTKKILNYLKSDDTLYFLGDSVDRGDNGIEVFNLFYNDPRVIFLKGNHEDLMARAIPYVYAEIEDPALCYYNNRFYQDWYYNGGNKTSKAFYNMTKEEVFKIRDIINELPTNCEYHSPKGHYVILEHAGYTPFDIPHRSHDPLWDREHFEDNWYGWGLNGSDYQNDFNPKNVYLVHGHTPVHFLKYEYNYWGKPKMTAEDMIEKRKFMRDEPMNFKEKIIRYCDGHKFDIDMGSAYSGRAALLDLDTFEPIYFDEEENKDENR